MSLVLAPLIKKHSSYFVNYFKQICNSQKYVNVKCCIINKNMIMVYRREKKQNKTRIKMRKLLRWIVSQSFFPQVHTVHFLQASDSFTSNPDDK